MSRNAGAVAPPSKDPRWRIVRTRMSCLGFQPDGLIEVLHAVQDVFGFLDAEALKYVGDALGTPPSVVYGVATFYNHFTLRPKGKHTCVVCTGTACFINGARAIISRVGGELGIEPGETTADGRVSLLTARCFGACGLAPAVTIDGVVQGKLRPDDVVAQLRETQVD